MNWTPETIKPTGSKILIRRLPPEARSEEIEEVKWAAVKIPCKYCLGIGCFPSRVYEEDGLRVAKHEERPCDKCGGKGYKSKGYETEADGHWREFWAEVLAVGPGAWAVKKRLSDGAVMKVYGHRETIPVAVGDRVLMARFAGYSGVSYYLTDDLLLVQPYEIMAVREAAEPEGS